MNIAIVTQSPQCLISNIFIYVHNDLTIRVKTSNILSNPMLVITGIFPEAQALASNRVLSPNFQANCLKVEEKE